MELADGLDEVSADAACEGERAKGGRAGCALVRLRVACHQLAEGRYDCEGVSAGGEGQGRGEGQAARTCRTLLVKERAALWRTPGT